MQQKRNFEKKEKGQKQNKEEETEVVGSRTTRAETELERKVVTLGGKNQTDNNELRLGSADSYKHTSKALSWKYFLQFFL